jgi:hypothetical protein
MEFKDTVVFSRSYGLLNVQTSVSIDILGGGMQGNFLRKRKCLWKLAIKLSSELKWKEISDVMSFFCRDKRCILLYSV